MKQRSNMNDKKFLHIIKLVLALIIIGGVSSSLYAKNEDTPNLDFSKGTWEGWTRYYGYYGPINMLTPTNGKVVSNSLETRDVDATDIWTLKDDQISGTSYGMFEIVSSSSNDNNLACDNLKLVPEGSTHTVRIGNLGFPEIYASGEGAGTWYRRAMAERMTYSFTVTEASSLLTYKYATVIQKDSEHESYHDSEGMAPFSVTVTANNGTVLCNSMVVKSDSELKKASIIQQKGTHQTVCTQYSDSCINFSNTQYYYERDLWGGGKRYYYYNNRWSRKNYDDYDNAMVWDATADCYRLCMERECLKSETIFIPDEKAYPCYQSNLTQEVLDEMYYKEWTTIVYDLRGYIGQAITIDVRNRDCLEQNWVCRICNKYETLTDITSTSGLTGRGFCSNCNATKNIDLRTMAGFHRTYGYFTAETSKMELTIQNCGDGHDAKITAPEGFASYVWKDPAGNLLATESDHPNVAIVPYGSIQSDKDYTCTMKSADPDCDPIVEKFKLNTPPIELDFTADVACFNEVQFTDNSKVLPVIIDGEEVIYDSIVNRVWSYYENGELVEIAEKNPLIQFNCKNNTTCTYDVKLTVWTANDCKREITKKVTVQPRPDVELLGEDKVCFGYSTPIQLENYNHSDNIYYWLNESGDTLAHGSGDAFRIYDAQPTNGTATYTLRIEREEKSNLNTIRTCRYIGEHNITVLETPTVAVTANNTYFPTIDGNPAKAIDICLKAKTHLTATTNMNCDIAWFEDINDILHTTEDNNISNYTHTITDSTKVYLKMYVEATSKTNGCKAYDSIYIKDLPIPTIEIDGPDEICANTTELYTAKGDGKPESYVWTTAEGNNFQMPGISITQPETNNGTSAKYTYSVMGVGVNGCSNSVTKEIEVFNAPVLSVNGSTQICEGGEIALSISGADSSSWDNGAQLLGGAEMREIPANTRKSYMVYGYKKNNTALCMNKIEIPITIHSKPNILITGITDICENQSVTLTASGASRYKWDDAKETENAEMTDSPNDTTIYKVIGYTDITPTLSCAGENSATVIVHDAPQFSLAAEPEKVCEGELTTITPTAKEGYQITSYQWDNGALNNTLTTSVNATQTFGVTATDRYGCTNRGTITVETKPFPALTINAGDAICENSEATIKVSGADEYTWEHGEEKGSVTNVTNKEGSFSHQPKGTGEVFYLITGTTEGCSTKEQAKVTISEAPAIAITGYENGVCLGGSVTLTASGSAKGKMYKWLDGNGETINNATGDNQEKLTLTPNESGLYQYTAIGYDSKGCEGKATITLEVYENPVVKIGGSDKNTNCIGTNVELTVAAPNTNIFNWALQDADENSLGDASGATINIPMQQTTKFTVEATDINGCKGKADTTIIAKPYPEFQISGNDYVCQSTKEITLQVTGTEGTQYTWTKGTTTTTGANFTDKNVNLDGQLSYDVTVSGDLDGCRLEQTYKLNIITPPNIYISGNNVYCEGEEVELTAKGGVEGNYIWNNDSEQKKDTFKTKASLDKTQFTVEGKDSRGCSNTATFDISVKEAPEVKIKTPESTEICRESTIKLEVEGAQNFTWEKVINNHAEDYACTNCGSINPQITEDVKYIVTGKDTEGCTSKDSISIEAKEIPEITITGAGVVCMNKGIVLEAKNINKNTTITKWVWSETDNDNNASTLTIEKLDGKRSFTVTATSSAGCEKQATAEADVYTPQSIGIDNGTGFVCYGGSMTIHAIGDADLTYTWKKKDDATWSANGKSVTIDNITSNFEIQLSAVDGQGCESFAEPKEIVSNPLPTITITSDKEGGLCKGNSIKLTAQEKNNATMQNGGWEWFDADKQSLDNKVGSLQLNNITEATTYYAVGKDINGCQSDTARYDINILSTPEVTIEGPDTVCKNREITLIAQTDAGNSVKWNNNNNDEGPQITETLTIAKEYTFTAIVNNSSCSTTASKKIVVNDNPQVTLTSVNGKSSVCEDDSIEIKANTQNDVTYSWENATSTSDIATYKPTEDSNTISCKVTVTEKNTNCQSSANFNVTVNRRPTLYINGEINGKSKVCEGDNISLTATGLSSKNYDWYADDVVVGGSDNYHPNVLKKTEYKVIGSDENGCKGEAIYTVDIKPFPTFEVANSTICSGEEAKVEVKNGNAEKYRWEWENGSYKGVEKETIYKETLTESKVYTLYGELDGCVTPVGKTATVTVKALPTIAIESNPLSKEICLNESITLNALGGESGKYSWSQGEGLAANNKDNVTITPEAAGTYSYNVSGEKDGCTNTGTINITVNPLPTVTIKSTEKNICIGESVTLNASGADSYVWSSGNSTWNGTSISPIIEKETTISLVGTDGKGCKSAPETITIQTKSKPVVSWTKVEVCEGADAEVVINGAESVIWKEDGITTTNRRTFDDVTEEKTYQITVINNGCEKDTFITIYVNKLPVISLTNNLGEKNAICKGDEVEMKASAENCKFTWKTAEDKVTISGADNELLTYRPTESGTREYRIIAKNNTTHCLDSINYTYNINDLPTNEIEGTNVVCINSTVRLESQGKNFATYSWAESSNSNYIIGTLPTLEAAIDSDKKYTLVISDQNGCRDTSSYDVNAVKYPTFNFEYDTVCANNSGKIKIKEVTPNTAQINWQWNGGTANNVSEVTATLKENTTFTVSAYVSIDDANRCETTQTFEATVYDAPSFTIQTNRDNDEICEGESIVLTTSDDSYTYTWKNPNGNKEEILGTTQTITVSPTGNTTYQATAINKENCQTEVTKNVNVNIRPKVEITKEGAACPGNTVTAIATGAETYKWLNNKQIEIGNYSNKQSIKIAEEGSTDTTFYAVGTSREGCSDTTEVKIQKLSKPKLEFKGNLAICENNIPDITVSGASVYQWFDEKGVIGVGEKLPVKQALTETQTYTVIGSDGENCSSEETITITVNKNPSVYISAANTDNMTKTNICLNDSVVLTAHADNVIFENWEDGKLLVKGESIGNKTYSVNVREKSTQCPGTATYDVNTLGLPGVKIVSSANSVCEGMTITLTSNDEYKTYQWYTYDGNNKTNLNSTIGSWTQPLTATTQYILEVTDENGCRNNDTATVIAKPYPVVKFSYPAVCSGTPAVITATESTADEYIWPTNGKSEGNVWTSEENLVNKKSFTITVGKEECYKSHSIEIDVNDKPNISVTVNGAETNGNSVEVCSGSDVILGVTSDNKTLNSYTWIANNTILSKKQEHSENALTNSTTYKIKVTDTESCENEKEQTIIVNTPQPIIISGNNSVCENGDVTLSASGSKNYSWTITPSNGATIRYNDDEKSNVTIQKITENVEIAVSGIDNKGCKNDTVKHTIAVTKQPTLTITSNTGKMELCSGESITLTATADDKSVIRWKNNSSDGEIYTTPTLNTTQKQSYTYEVSVNYGEGNTCKADSIVTIIANPLPIVQITGDIAFCEGGNSTLTASEMYGNSNMTFAWTNFDKGVNPIEVTESGTYEVEAIDNVTGCISEKKEYIVTKYNNPIEVTISSEEAACKDSTITLVANSKNKMEYEWYQLGANNEKTHVGSGSSIEQTITKDEQYKVEVAEPHTLSNGQILRCYDTIDYAVIVKESPVFYFNAESICYGEDLTISIDGPTDAEYTWNKQNHVGQSYTDKELKEAGSYSVTALLDGCALTKDTTINIYALPVINSLNAEESVCLKSEMMITSDCMGSGALSYSWTTNKDQNSIISNTNGATLKVAPTTQDERKYYLEVTDENNCKNKDSIIIGIKSLPTIDIDGDLTVCKNSDVTLSVNNNLTFNWYQYNDATSTKGDLLMSGSGNDPFTQTITEDRAFYLEVENSDGCTNGEIVRVKTNELPEIKWSGKNEICYGEESEIVFIAQQAGDKYTLTDENNNIEENILSKIFSPTATTKYKIEVTSSNNCTNTGELEIKVNALPEITINNVKEGSSNICLNSEIELGAGSNVPCQFKWNTSSTEDTIKVTANTLAGFTAVLVGTDGNGCVDSAKFDVIGLPLPTIAIGGDNKACEGSTAEVYVKNVTQNMNYLWKDNNSTDVERKVTIDKDTIMYITGIDKNTQCSNEGSFKITKIKYPTLEVTPSDTTVCLGNEITFKATSDAAIIYWNGNASAKKQYKHVVNEAGEITISAEDNSCTTSKVVKVNYYELPKVEISNPGIICENSKKELIAEVTGGNAPYNYEWSGLIASSEENKAVTNLLTPADNNEKFKVSVTDKNGCIGTDSTQVEVAENPTITIAVENSEICDGDIARLTASGAGNEGTYLWNTNETGAIITPTIHGEISFNVTGTDHNNCVGTSEYVTIKKKDLPQLEVSGDNEICVGESTTITLSAKGSNSAKFYWIEDSEIGQYAKAIEGATRELSPSELTSYKVRIEDNGCSVEGEFNIKVNSLPEIKIGSSVTENTLCLGEKITLTATDNLINYQWRDKNNNNLGSTNQIAITPTEQAEYKVIAEDENGCINSDSIVVYVNQRPKILLESADAACMNSTLALTAKDVEGYPRADEYNWGALSMNTKANVITTTHTATTTYQVIATAQNGCKDTATRKVEVIDLPTFELTNNSPLCYGGKAEISIKNAGAAYSYTWPKDGTVTNNENWKETIVRNANNDYTYNVTGTISKEVENKTYQCSTEVKTTIRVNTLPEIKLMGTSFICQDETSIELSVNGPTGVEYSWSAKDNSGSIEEATENSAIATPSNEELLTYYVEGTDQNKCSQKDSIFIQRAQNPTFNLADETIIVCYGGNTELEITSDDRNIENVTWSEEGQVGNSLKITNVTENKTVTATAISDKGCTAEKTFKIEVKELPKLDIDYKEFVCKNDLATIKVKGVNEIVWNNSTYTETLTIEQTLTKDSTFHFVGKNIYTTDRRTVTCENNHSITIGVNALPEIYFSAKPAICEGETTTITAEARNAIEPYNYNWGSSDNKNSVTITPQQDTTLRVVVTDNNECSNSAKYELTVHPKPTFQIKPVVVCDGMTAELVADNANLKYRWAGSADYSNSKTFTTSAITAPTTITVIAMDNNNCTNENSVNVGWKPMPKLEITGENIVCYNSSVVLEVKDNSGYDTPTTYVWNRQSNENSAIFESDKITTPTTFKVIGTKDGCVDSTEKTISVNSLPTINISGNLEVCKNGTIDLQGTGALRYKWNDQSYPEDGTSNEMFEYKENGQNTLITVWGIDANGCENSKSAAITINPTPRFNITGDTIACFNSNILLTAQKENSTIGNLIYEWRNPDSSLVSTDDYLKVTVTKDTTFTINGISDKGCVATKTFSVKVKQAPTIEVENYVETVCKGNETNISLKNNASEIYWEDNLGNILSNNESVTSIISNNGTRFNVHLTNNYPLNNGVLACKKDSVFVVNVWDLPFVQINGENEICLGDKITLTATENLEYVWVNVTKDDTLDLTTQTIEEQPIATTNYKVIATDKNNCSNEISKTVIVNPLPTFNLTSNESAVCVGNDINIKASNTALLYNWEGNGYQSIFNHTYKVDSTMNIVVYAMDNETKCESKNSIKVGIKEYPVISIDAPDYICTGASATVAGLIDDVNYTWRENNENGEILSTEKSLTLTNIESDKQIYATIEKNGCTSDTTFIIRTWSLPNVKIDGSPSLSLCYDNSKELTVSGAQEYIWNNDNNLTGTVYQTAKLTEDTQVKVLGVDENGCKNQDSIMIYINELPTFNIVGKTEICINNDIELNASNDGLSYIWKNKVGEVVSSHQYINTTITKDTTFYVVGTNALGCSDTKEHTITTKAYPVITTIADSNIVCKGEMAYIEVATDIASEYIWNNDNTQTDNKISKAVQEQTTFIVKATSKDGNCTSEKEYVVSTRELPTLLASDVTICKNESAVLQASSSSEIKKYSWVGTDSVGSQFTTPAISEATTYTVIGEDIFGCRGEKEIAIHINDLPKFTLSNEKAVCKDGETEIVASNPTLKYDWGSGYKTDIKQTIKVEKDTTITVWAMDDNGCKTKESTTIQTKELPILKFELPSDYVCLNENIRIKVSGAIDGYKWMNGSTSESITLEEVTTVQEVYVEGTTNGCITRIDTTIKVWTLPQIGIEATSEYICKGDSIELTATGGLAGKYQWKNGASTDKIIVKPTYDNMTYQVVGEDENGCKNSYSKDIIIQELPIVMIEGINEVCRGEKAELSATGSSDFYVWTTGDGVATDTIGTTSMITPIIDKDEITFRVEGKDAYGCVGYNEYAVRAKEFPILSYKTNTEKDSVCKGENFKIEVDGADSYIWQNGSTATFAESILMNPTKYTIEGTTNGCTSTLTVNVGIWQLPEFSIEGERAVCAGGEITLNAVPTIAGTSYNYVWEDYNETTASITQKLETPNTTVTYKAVATDKNNCTNFKAHSVKVNPLPTDIAISGETSICVGTETTLTATGSAIDYLWSNGTSSNEITPTITTKDSTFAVTGTDVNGCQYTTEIKVTTKEYPTLKIEYPEYVCVGDSATITVSGADSFVWEDTQDNNPVRKEKIDTDTKFVIEGTINGCTTREEITIRVWSLPSIWISTTDTDNEICKNESITLVASGGVSGKYVWNNDASQTGDQLTVSPTENQTYTIIGEDENGCRSGNSFEVIVNELPTVKIEGTPLICAGDNVTLSAVTTGEAVKTYAWSNGEAKKEIEVAVNEETVFSVTIEDVNGCTANNSYTVATKPYPELTYNAPKHICIGDQVAVTVTGATTYKWEDAPELTANNFIDNPAKDTTYKVSGTTNGCTSYLDIPLMVMPIPEIWISSSTNEICKNTSIQMSANGGVSYQWSTKANTQSIEVTPITTTEYRVVGTDSYGCIGEATKTIIVNELPEFKILGESQICEGNNTMLWVEGNAIRYTWTNTGEQGDTIYPTINKSTTFTVLAENVKGCTRQESKTVASKPYPVLNYSAPETLCDGETLEIIVNGADSYKWQDGSTDNRYTETLHSSSTYTVEGTTNGCTTKEQFSVNVLPLPYIWITGSSDICLNDKVTLDAKGAATYEWETGDETNTITVTPTDTTTYVVTGTDVNGCSSTTHFTVNVHPLPEVAIEGEDAVCNGESVQLNASGRANEFRWSTGQEGMSIHPIITKTETFKLIGTDNFGCIREVSKQVVMKPNPILIFNAPSSVCYGSEAKIIVTGADEFEWQDGTKGKEYTDKPENMTTYSVVGTTNGCSTQQKFQIDVLPLPTIWISGASEICENSGVKLSASGGLSYEWNTGLKSAELYANPTTTTTYEVTGKDVNGCQNTKSYTVKVNPLPNFTIEGPTQVCKGDAAELNIKGDNYKYTWSNGAITSNISPIVTENTTFTVEAINEFGCTTKKNHSVLSIPYPTLIYNGPKVVCEGSKVQLTVVGADTYLWGDSVEGNKLIVYPEANTTYSVKGGTKGCYSELNIPIDILQKPTLTYQGKTNICEGELLSLTVHGANSYTWSNGNNSDKIETYQKSSTQYIVEGKDEKGCSNEITIDVTVNPAPKFEIIGRDQVCRGHETELIATGDATTYQWGFGTSDLDDYESANNTPVKVTINTPTYIFVKGINNNGCHSTQYKTITTKESPTISFEGDTAVCIGDSVQLRGLGADSYVWKQNNTVLSEEHLLAFEPKGNTRIVLTGHLDDCSSSIEIYIKTNVLPALKIMGDEAICQDQEAVLTADGAYEYKWSTGETTATISHPLKQDGLFKVTGYSENGCSSSKEITVKVHPLPNVDLTEKTTGCRAEETEVVAKATGGERYEWWSAPFNSFISGNIADSVIATITEPTTIYVMGYDSNGCVKRDSVVVDTVQTIQMEFTVTPKVVEESNPIVTLEGIIPKNAKWMWVPNTTDDDVIEEEKKTYTIKNAKNKNEVTYMVYAVDDKGCKYNGDSTVYIWKDFWAPNAFTPNGDLINDKFRFKGCEYMTEFTFTIYDRTGRIVFEGHSAEDAWDGTCKGEPCPWGVYGYVVNYVSDYINIHKEGVKKGEVTLIR